MGEKWPMKNQAISLMQTLAGREYEQFLRDYGFCLVLDENGDRFSCTVVENSEILLAFTYQAGFGENLAVAELGAPVNATAIATRSDGWSLIGEVWKEAYEEFHKVKRELPYPHNMDRQHEVAIVDRSLRLFMDKVKNKEISIGSPKFRMGV